MIKLFSDNAKLYSPIKEENDRIRMQVGLKNAEEWAKIWKIVFYIKKCKYLHIEKNSYGHTICHVSGQTSNR